MTENQKLREALQVARDHIDMDALEISHCKDATLIRQALALPTAAPVGEREAFEEWAKDNAIRTDLGAWEAWQARAALNAGDALDAARYRWLMDNCTLGIKQNGVGWSLNTSACVAPDCIKDVGAAIDAAMRKAKP